ncbi:NACHT domain-containing protein [Actinokineospora cianjurensis]|uniref:NACHT domain-containing protein n=1 Tax=Actinokineospora cianjurensis TaxID=585224 RepID=A0A421AX51_9PSEU|nr:NACHT domain-containing protein [Actinokineospora cianjurensis]RLK54415.1 NACHT domain-containing protein [Actinokineospora cianjurensis]
MVGWQQLPRMQVGDVDPFSAVVALAALAAALWSGRQSVRAAQSTPVAVVEVAARLADEVRHREGRTRTQLLGGGRRTINVDFDFRSVPAHGADDAATAGRLAEVVDYYQALRPQRLVITGAAGAGKTVLALELLLGLLEVRSAEDPVPVRIPATAWDIERPLRDWLIQHLIDAYGQTSRTARALVDAGRILPVIDGLDELDAEPTPAYTSNAARAIEALNAYQHGRQAAPLVLTCRTLHYQALTDVDVWTHEAALVTIRAVDSDKARAFILSRVDTPGRWKAVLSTLQHHPDGPLAEGLSTPWRLSLATVVYEQRDRTGAHIRDPDDLIAVAVTGDPTAVRDHLLAHFIPAATAVYTTASNTEPPYTAEQIHQWLAVLAGYLHHNATTGRAVGDVPLSGTDLVLHQLWPLGGINRVRGTVIAMTALLWLIATAILLTRNGIGFSPGQIYGFTSAMLLIVPLAYTSWRELWPVPLRINTRQFHTNKGRHQLAGFCLTFGLATGLSAGLAGWLFGPADGLAGGLAGGLAVGLTLGLALGLTRGTPWEHHDAASGTWDPREIVRQDFALTLGLGLVFWLMIWLTIGLTPAVILGLMLGSGSLAGLGFGGTGIRYAALLLCTRDLFTSRPLPWRLSRFLHWCYHTGLIRQAGIGYQFRHRELQDHLAQHPHPTTP